MLEESGSKFNQFIAAIAANLCILVAGNIAGSANPLLMKLKANVTDSYVSPLSEKITDEEGSWIVSLTPMGILVGSFIAPYLAETIGRKRTLLLTTVPYVTYWILIAIATNVTMLYIARLIGGLGIALSITVVPMYTGEIAEPSIRGILGSFLEVFMTIGLVCAYSIGSYVTYTVFCISCIILPVIFFISFFFMPESPYYLSAKGKHFEVITTLAKLRGKSIQAVKAEADEIKKSVEEAYNHEVSIMDLFRFKCNLKALIYTSVLMIFQQMSGVATVVSYSQTIFDATKAEGAAESFLSPSLSSIVVAMVQLSANCFTPIFVDRFGRKIFLLISGIGMTISLIALGSFFFLKKLADEDGKDISSLGWLPVASLMVFIASYSIGWGPVPWAMMGEMFASDIKAKASGIIVFEVASLFFLITKFFENVAAAFGLYTVFWLFGVFCVISILLTMFILPETKGKTLQLIQKELRGGSTADALHSNEQERERFPVNL